MIRSLAVAALTAGLLIPTAPAANAGDPCLHRAHFRHAARSALSPNPMSRQEVHELFGTRGRPVGYRTRVYRGCGDSSRAWVQYRRDAEGIPRALATAYTWRYFGDGLTTLHPA